jgi:hypothetical protein
MGITNPGSPGQRADRHAVRVVLLAADRSRAKTEGTDGKLLLRSCGTSEDAGSRHADRGKAGGAVVLLRSAVVRDPHRWFRWNRCEAGCCVYCSAKLHRRSLSRPLRRLVQRALSAHEIPSVASSPLRLVVLNYRPENREIATMLRADKLG